MKDDKYSKNVGLLCPTCSCSHFEYEKGIDEAIELAKCTFCGREITKDELINENSENINEHIKEIGKQITKDIAKEFKSSLKKAFRGSKHIRFK